jgi:hypothetical protein
MQILAKDTHPLELDVLNYWRDVFRDLAGNLSDRSGQRQAELRQGCEQIRHARSS